jgi:hypothetical protein
MPLGCFILEDSDSAFAVWEDFVRRAGFENVLRANNVEDAKKIISEHIRELVAFILDMSTPLTADPKEEPHPHAGPSVRNHLITDWSVSPDSILLTSNVISEYDLQSCCYHRIDPSLIVGKEELSVEKIKRTFASVLQK